MLYKNFPDPVAQLVDEIAIHMNGRGKNRWIHSLESALPDSFSETDFEPILHHFSYDLLVQKAKPLVPKKDKELQNLMDDTITLFKRAVDGDPPSIEEWEVAKLLAYVVATYSVGKRRCLADIAYVAWDTDSDAPADTLEAIYVVLKKTKRNTTEFWLWAADLLLALFRKAGVPQRVRSCNSLAA